ncbi:hypothetical protein CXB51_029149 [Gossypium anomalum]|uniref:Terpene synthase N-terminal domain-containing protein n=1 Tax=Gossypium anomalum TaxID=47600 RepID=A0A8J5Y8F8_9ROSI|nr:hypothetical protein CXB51_029149 [Gossypium anomalum]
MSSQNSANLVATQDNKMSKENRHLADFNPNFWGDIFLSSLAETIDDNLYTASVRFRLLREHGFNESNISNTFNKFINEKGKFKESLISDVKGMLELYEVAHFQLHEETILEEAHAFTMFHLKLAETTMDYPLSTQIANALKQPLRKSLPRLVARSYIPICEGYATVDKNLMKFAKLDFNMVQHLHKEEVVEMFRCCD